MRSRSLPSVTGAKPLPATRAIFLLTQQSKREETVERIKRVGRAKFDAAIMNTKITR